MADMFRRAGGQSRTAVIEEPLLAGQAAGEHSEDDVELDPHWRTTLTPCVIRRTSWSGSFLRPKASLAYELVSRVARPRDFIDQPLEVLLRTVLLVSKETAF